MDKNETFLNSKYILTKLKEVENVVEILVLKSELPNCRKIQVFQNFPHTPLLSRVVVVGVINLAACH